MLLLASLSLGTAALALLISRATLTAPIRERLRGRLKDGASCSYCCCFWLSALLVTVYGAPSAPLGEPLPWTLAVLAVWGGSAAAVGIADGAVGD